jgi:D-alanyl-lipoteichoic acid acyltransferase DltB (MBOAT superfamily)|tara:strand:+ start:7398 stop:8759 length:1362 start_codon:yes stop_codon:yes gene_type:complete
MLFNSFIYLFLFLPIFFIIFFFIEKRIVSKFSILVANLIFYSWLNFKFVFIITFSVLINYFFSKFFLSEDKKLPINKKSALIIAILFNISLLIFFKYLDFLIININYLFGSSFKEFILPFPLALSFFTLQQITFLVNCYDKQIIKVKFIDYFNYVSFFPQLIAGPIVLFKDLNYKLNIKNRKINYSNIYKGLTFISIGLFKKIVIADNLFHLSDYGFTNLDNITIIDSWIASTAFSLQFYFDFSGYADIAIGSALLFNIRLPINFNSPFKSVSVIDFWKRWHITLSNFITNYMYFPLIKYFENKYFYNIFSIILVMTVAGIWHGPRWTYVIFGLMHGLALSFNHLFNFRLNKIISIFITFIFVNFSFVFFNSKTINNALNMISKMFKFNNLEYNYNLNNILFIFFAMIIVFCLKNSNKIFNIKPSFKNTFLIIILLIVSIFNLEEKRFIYFDF